MNHTVPVIRVIYHQFFFNGNYRIHLPVKTNPKKQVSIIRVMFVRVMKEQQKIVLSLIS